jgi:hypothetical protein
MFGDQVDKGDLDGQHVLMMGTAIVTAGTMRTIMTSPFPLDTGGATWQGSTGHGSGKNARRRKAQIVFWDESGVSLLPVVRRTWAPVGSTPVLDHHCNWKRVSIAAALCYGSRGGGARLASTCVIVPTPYDTDALTQLRRFLAGEKATLLWDGLPAHRSRDMQRFLASQRRWLVVERLPGYVRSSTRWRRCGPTSRGWSWPTWLPTPSTRSPRRSLAGSTESARPQLPFSFLRHSGLAA